MAVAFRSVTSSTGVAPALPSGTTTDDIVLAIGSVENVAATFGAPSADWTAINTDTDVAAQGTIQHRTWWARKTAAALSTTWTSSDGSARVCLITFSGCRTTGSPINVSSYAEGTDSTAEHATITPTVADCMIVGLMNVFNWGSSSSSAFTNERLDQAESISIYDDGLLASGATGSLLVTSLGSLWGATLVALEPPSAAAVRDQEGYRWRDDDGSEAAASWLAAQDTAITRLAGLNTRLRVLTNITNDAPSEALKLRYRAQGEAELHDLGGPL